MRISHVITFSLILNNLIFFQRCINYWMHVVASSLLTCLWLIKFFFRSVNTDGFKPNLESHLVPLFARDFEETTGKSEAPSLSIKNPHHSLLIQVFLSISVSIIYLDLKKMTWFVYERWIIHSYYSLYFMLWKIIL